MTSTAAARVAGVHSREVRFVYDYLGRRVQKRVQALTTAGAPTGDPTLTRYLYDGWNLVAEYAVNAQTSALTLSRSFTWGLDAGGSLAAVGSNGALVQITDHATGISYLPTYDGNGNVAALVQANTVGSAVAGMVVATYEYGPFGELLRCEGAYARANPFRFATKYADEETGLIYYGHRYYSPDLGRFINRDPFEESGGLNLYGFAANDGINGGDILGLQENSRIVVLGPGDASRPGDRGGIRPTQPGAPEFPSQVIDPAVIRSGNASGAARTRSVVVSGKILPLIDADTNANGPTADEMLEELRNYFNTDEDQVYRRRGERFIETIGSGAEYIVEAELNCVELTLEFVPAGGTLARVVKIGWRLYRSQGDARSSGYGVQRQTEQQQMSGTQTPYGFKNAREFDDFAKNLNEGLKKFGDDVQAIFQGSSVTGKSYETGKPFDSGRTSDFDIALVGKELFEKAKAAGIELRGGGTRTRPLSQADLEKLGLSELAAQMGAQSGRPVNFMIYETTGAAVARAPSIPVPK